MQIVRIGVYAILVDTAKILLTKKVKGPFLGLLDLPGGGIEFKETPKEALKREMKEEVAIQFTEMKLFDNFSHHGTYKDGDRSYEFHHIGLIYTLKHFSKIPNVEPQDPFNWYHLNDLVQSSLTPFAKEAVRKILGIIFVKD